MGYLTEEQAAIRWAAAQAGETDPDAYFEREMERRSAIRRERAERERVERMREQGRRRLAASSARSRARLVGLSPSQRLRRAFADAYDRRWNDPLSLMVYDEDGGSWLDQLPGEPDLDPAVALVRGEEADRLHRILGDLDEADIARLNEETLRRLRTRLVREGLVHISVTRKERERLREPTPHRGPDMGHTHFGMLAANWEREEEEAYA